MKAKVKYALNRSIKHWQQNVNAEFTDDIHMSSETCALCQMFFYCPNYCKGCPIRQVTGYRCCEKTPYKKAYNLWSNMRFGSPVTPELRQAMEAELLFLKAIRPIE